MFAIIDCDTTLAQTGSSLSYDSTCRTPPEPAAHFPPFEQIATGSIDVVTGEWLLAGTQDHLDFTESGCPSACTSRR